MAAAGDQGSGGGGGQRASGSGASVVELAPPGVVSPGVRAAERTGDGGGCFGLTPGQGEREWPPCGGKGVVCAHGAIQLPRNRNSHRRTPVLIRNRAVN